MNRELRDILRETEKGRRFLARIDGEKRSAKARKAPKRKAGAEKKRIEREQHAASTAVIRARDLLRASGFGELCGRALGSDVEMCHLNGGSGKRRRMQSIENTLIEHHECHQGPLGLDKKPLAWLPAVKAWCERYGYPLPERFRKLEALAASRAAPGSDGPSNWAVDDEGVTK